jgi:hypothetical protein
MELTMERASPLYEDLIAQCENSFIRHFNVPDRYNFNAPQTDLESGSWESANPKNILHFSATAYFFARELYEKYRVPIGLINASLGGSPVEAWMSEEALKSFPVHYDEAQRFKESTLINQIQSYDRDIRNAWYNRLKQLDQGYKDKEKPWYDPAYDASAWSTMKLPGYWADGDLGPLNGVVWFRDVGQRLSLAAQKIAYGDQNIVYSGPIYQLMKIDDNKITVTFTSTGSGLVVKGGGELKYFAIAGTDRKFLWAKAKIINNTVVVWHDHILHPVAVRYAWADNPEGANLYNMEGLPASPFRTDDF